MDSKIPFNIPLYRILADIFLDFQLDPNHTVVTAKTTFQRLNDEATHLRLDGYGFQFAFIEFNGEDFKHYHQDHESLTLDLTNLSAANFELEIVTNLEPAQNISL